MRVAVTAVSVGDIDVINNASCDVIRDVSGRYQDGT